MDIVPDEWVLDCARPDNERYSISRKFLDAVERKRDRLAIRQDSPFTRKLAKFGKIYPIEFKRLFLILYDSSKVVQFGDDDITRLPQEIENTVPDDDRYLVELAFSTPDKVFVTTDNRLKEKIKGLGDLRVFLYDEFMHFYDR